ncbi:MAG: signal peptidase I [Limisphaerales bacterium]
MAILATAVQLLLSGCQKASLVSSSMAPTIKPGETVTIDYISYAVAPPKRWDVIAFEPPMITNQVWLMRVIGLPGETVLFTNGTFTVNGTPVTLPAHLTNVVYVAAGRIGVASPFTVPSNRYFVVGDNSANANDSRFWGALPRTNILGRVRNK